MMLNDDTGKQHPALIVIAAVIKYLKDYLMEFFKDKIAGVMTSSDVNRVLTVPAIWNERAKQFLSCKYHTQNRSSDRLELLKKRINPKIFDDHDELRHFCL